MGMISAYQKGGKVKGKGGPTDDAVTAKLSNGEYVIPADVVHKVGTHALDSMVANFHKKAEKAKGKANGGRISAYANGGKVKGYADGGEVTDGTTRSGFPTLKTAPQPNENTPATPAIDPAAVSPRTPDQPEADYSKSLGAKGPAPEKDSDVDQFLKSEARDAGTVAANQGGAAAAGRTARTVVETPLVAAASKLPDIRSGINAAGSAVKSGVGAISDFARGLVGAGGSSAAPSANPAPASGGGFDPFNPQPGPRDTVRVSSGSPATTPSTTTAASSSPGGASDEPAQPSNVRAYLRPPSVQPVTAAPAAPTVDPEAFARNAVSMGRVLPGASLGEAEDANVAAHTYAKNYLAALRGANEAYTGETGRISSLANAQLAGAHSNLAGAQVEELGEKGALERYSLEQQKNLTQMGKDLADLHTQIDKETDPKKKAQLEEDLRNKEMQLWILHGKPPRPDNRYQAVQGRFNPMTGQYEQGVVLDRSSGQTQPLATGQPKASAAPYAEGTRLTGPNGQSYVVQNGQPVPADF